MKLFSEFQQLSEPLLITSQKYSCLHVRAFY